MKKQKHGTEHHRSKYTKDDMNMFEDWIREETDINWCIKTIILEYDVRERTAYRWMEQAAKNVKKTRRK